MLEHNKNDFAIATYDKDGNLSRPPEGTSIDEVVYVGHAGIVTFIDSGAAAPAALVDRGVSATGRKLAADITAAAPNVETVKLIGCNSCTQTVGDHSLSSDLFRSLEKAAKQPVRVWGFSDQEGHIDPVFSKGQVKSVTIAPGPESLVTPTLPAKNFDEMQGAPK